MGLKYCIQVGKMIVMTPMAGYLVPFFQDQSGLAQALAYVHTLQNALVVKEGMVDSGTAMVSSFIRHISIHDLFI